jgi:hypothetical protein
VSESGENVGICLIDDFIRQGILDQMRDRNRVEGRLECHRNNCSNSRAHYGRINAFKNNNYAHNLTKKKGFPMIADTNGLNRSKKEHSILLNKRLYVCV